MFKQIFSRTSISEELINQVKSRLENFEHPLFKGNLKEVVCNIELTAKKSTLTINLVMPFVCQSIFDELIAEFNELIDGELEFNLSYQIAEVRKHNLAGVKNIIAVASGKGGVGKSTTTVNLAHALMAEGAKVGILDADIYGPSIPIMLGVSEQKPGTLDSKTMIPIKAHELTLMSIGFLVPDEDAAVWRGPMASRALEQLLNETDWGYHAKPALDYLLIDMPPGTGDIQITLSQKIPVAGAVVVTTPQNVALNDAIKGITMFEKVQLPVLGVVENMSYHICDNCGHHAHIFGEGGGKFVSEQYETPLLGQLPLNSELRADMDCGISIFAENSASDLAEQYRRIAQNLSAQVYYQLDSTSPDTIDIRVVEE